MIRTALLTALALTALPLGFALAQEPPQVQRHELMEQNGEDAKALGAMAKGTTQYDPADAKVRLDRIAKDTKLFVTLFPEGSETGHKTRAAPQIWSNRAGFEAKADALVQAASAASDATSGGIEDFRAAFGKVGQACQGCHMAFRAPEQ